LDWQRKSKKIIAAVAAQTLSWGSFLGTFFLSRQEIKYTLYIGLFSGLAKKN